MANEGIELQIYSYADPTVYLGTIEARVDPQYLEEITANGDASFLVHVNDPKIVNNPNFLKSRNIAKYKVNGVVVGAWIIGLKDKVIVDTAEGAEEMYQVSGKGLKQWLDDAEVRPYGGLKATSKDSRTFSFASELGTWYDAGLWIDPIVINNVLGNMWSYGPDKWPDGATQAKWIWGTANSNPQAPVGYNYFRATVPISVAGDYAFYIAVDDFWSLYLDGEEISKTEVEVGHWQEAKRVNMTLDVGTHIIGVRAGNIRGAGGFVGALYRITPRVAPVNVGTATIAVGVDALVTRNGHGIANGTKVHFTTTGALPVGLSANKDYYVRDSGTNNFRLANSVGGPAIDTSGTQSGTHTLFRSEIPEKPTLVTYTGMTVAALNAAYNTANNVVTQRLNAYNALPAGNASGNNTQKKQAAAKATAYAAYQKAIQDRSVIDVERSAAVASASAGITWKVLPYPLQAPGWTPGEIMLTLIDEAAARGVLAMDKIEPTFTALVDSYGNAWPEPSEWSFKIGESLLSVAGKLEELTCDMWIDPETYELNIVAERGVDRSVYKYDVDGITVLESPVIFRKGKNLRSAGITSRGKIKNSLSLKTETGWVEGEYQDEDSVNEYGVIEGTLDTGASRAVSEQLADLIFKQRAQEEEGASYDVYLPADGKVPWKDFQVGDWALAPDAQGLLVKRRIVSISLAEGPSGNPLYTLEFDTVFHTNEDRLNKVIEKLGGGGVGSSYGNAGGIGGLDPTGPTVQPTPDFPDILTIPSVPVDVEIFSYGEWDANGVNPIAYASISWAPVTENTDGSETVPAYYEVWGYSTEAGIESDQMWAAPVEPKATIGPFTPGMEWNFRVLASHGSNRMGQPSQEVTHVMGGPNTPMAAPDTPTLASGQGLLSITWNGNLGGNPPPAWFRYVYAEVGTSATGPWTRKGATLARDGRTITIPGEPIGESRWARLFAIDGVGLSSSASAVAGPVTILGVNLGDLEADVNAAIQAATDAAQEASEAADAATIAAELAQDDVDALELDVDALALEVADALATAEEAMSTASGMQTWSPNVPTTPDGAGRPTGAIWYRTSAYGIIAQYQWTGSAWTSRPIDNDAIFSINAVKITAGTLDAARIAANSITAEKLLVGNFDNLIPDPGFLNPTISGWNNAVFTHMPGGGRTANQNALRITSNATQRGAYNPTNITVEPGDIYRLSVWVRSSIALPAGSNLLTPYFQIDRVGTTMTTGGLNNSAAIPLNTWTKLETNFTIPADGYRVRAGLFLQAIVPNGALVDLTEPEMVRVSDTTLIADGAVTTDKITALAITAAKIAAGTITGDKIAASTISTSKLLVTSLDNMVEDGGFEYSNVSGVSWTLAGGASIGTTTPRSGVRSLGIPTNGSSAFVAATTVSAFQVEQGEHYRVEAWARLVSGTVDLTGVAFRFVYGPSEASTPTVTADIADSPESTGTTYTLHEGVWEVPAGAKFARLVVVMRDTTASKTYLVDDIGVYKMSTGKLIVDGAVTAEKIAAQTIIGENIKAGAIATDHIQANAITSAKISADAVTAEHIAANSIEANMIKAGAIAVTHVSPSFGTDLNLSANNAITLIAGDISAVDGKVDDTQENLELMQTYYSFGANGAVISKPGSVFATAIRNDRIEMLENGNVISYWNSGQLFVNQFVGEIVTLGNHQIAKYGTGTVVRAL